jgi:alkanesulfonate monooxygenase SsuD/methylene tetrahydromethanopterin reductase-like flavin-dependent oxidoreductase (luciferase family)
MVSANLNYVTGGTKPEVRWMEFGVHLPVMAWGGEAFTLDSLLLYAETATRLGFRALSTNDHLVFNRPWLDGPTALASVLERTGDMTLATTISLPVVRGPVPLAKALAAIDVLSGGRVVVGVGPGSLDRDYAAVGIPWVERWPRFEEAIQALRALWREGEPFEGRFYSTVDVRLEPSPAQPGGPPIWVGSWGSNAGLRRVARLGDGWLASGYNATPETFAENLSGLRERLREIGRNPDTFPNAIASMFFFITEDETLAERILTERIGPTLHRPASEMSERLLVGPAAACAERLASYDEAGAQLVFLWPVDDEIRQLEAFAERVVPLIGSRR